MRLLISILSLITHALILSCSGEKDVEEAVDEENFFDGIEATTSLDSLKNEMATVYNSVLREGMVEIDHRDRPNMILIERETLDNALLDDSLKSALIADLTF